MASRPVRVNHVGLCVQDLDAAVAWYGEVFGLERLAGPEPLEADEGRAGDVLRDVFGPTFRAARIAHLGCEGDVGLELFEFVEPEGTRPQQASYFHAGFSHLCFTVKDIDETAGRIRAAGGRILTRVWEEHPGRPYRFVHCADPFGNLLELHSHGHRETVLGARER